jgi:hypothetical protein
LDDERRLFLGSNDEGMVRIPMMSQVTSGRLEGTPHRRKSIVHLKCGEDGNRRNGMRRDGMDGRTNGWADNDG